MEANKIRSVWRSRLIEAKDKKEYIKLIFQYPSSDRAIIKRGKVLEIFDDGFDFDEKFDGKVSYAFDYIVEIKPEEERK